MSDEEIIRLIKRGNKNLFVQIIRKYYKSIEKFIIKIISDKTNIEDVIQEIFIRIFEKLYTYDESKPFKPWLYKVVYISCYKYLSNTYNSSYSSKEINTEKIINENESPESIVVNKILFEDLIAKLPSKLQILFILRHGLELSYDEIAYVLDEPIGTVKSNLYRTRKLLKKIWDAHYDQEKIDSKKDPSNDYYTPESLDN